MSILAVGPFIGDWEQEISTFRPYVCWLTKVFPHDDIYLSTHFNRKFLYNWIPEKNFVPVYEDISRNEILQNGYTYEHFLLKDFSILSKYFKDEVLNRAGVGRREIINFNVTYTKNTQPFPIYNKLFCSIDVPDIKIKHKAKIIYIPDNKENIEFSAQVYKRLKKCYNVSVIGDFKIHHVENNLLLKHVDYFENVYKYIIKYISESDAVICPVGHWTLLCNMMGKKVFSWGPTSSLYAKGGIYNFSNNKSFIIPKDTDLTPEKIVHLFKTFVEIK
jgi:hypothetical protein